MNNHALTFFLGACFLGISLLVLSPPQAYWTEVGEGTIKVLDLEIKVEEVGFDQFDDFDLVISYDGDGEWEGLMLGNEKGTNYNDGGYGYAKKIKGKTPCEVAEKMIAELLTLEK